MNLFDQIIVSVVASIATATFAYLGFWRKAKIELRKEFENKFNDRKWEAYIKNIELTNLYRQENTILSNSTHSRTKNDENKLRDLSNKIDQIETQVENEILLVGSKEVVDSYIRWKSALCNYSYDSPDTFERMIDCISSMRKDLGLEKSDLNYQIFDHYAYVSRESYKDFVGQKKETQV